MQSYGNCAETHLGGGNVGAFCHAVGRRCSIALFDVGCQCSLTKAPQGLWPHGRDRCRSLVLAGWSSPCGRGCGWCRVFPLVTIAGDRLSVVAAWHVRWFGIAAILGLRCGGSQPALRRLPGVRLPLVIKHKIKTLAWGLRYEHCWWVMSLLWHGAGAHGPSQPSSGEAIHTHVFLSLPPGIFPTLPGYTSRLAPRPTLWPQLPMSLAPVVFNLFLSRSVVNYICCYTPLRGKIVPRNIM